MTTTTLVEARRNLAPNPRAGVGVGGYTAELVGGSGTLTRRDDGSPVPGGTYVRVLWSGASTAAGGGYLYGTGTGADNPHVIPVTPGQRIVLSAYARPSRERVLGLAAWFYTAAGTLISGGGLVADSTVGPVAPGEWTRIVAGVIPPATAARVRFGPRAALADDRWAAGDYLDGTGLLAEVDAVVGEYFDGDAPAPAGQLNTWGGTPHQSASLRLRTVQQSSQAPLTDGSYFTPRSARVWTLGDPDRPDVAFNGMDDRGVEWVISDPKGWYESPPVNLGLEDKPEDGAWFGPGAYKSRVIEIEGAFRVCRGGPDALEAAVERLQDALHPRVDTLLAVTETIPKQLTVRPSGEVIVLPVRGVRNARTFSFVLTAADPFKYAAGAAGLVEESFGLLDPTQVPGLAHPVQHPASHASGGSGFLGGRLLVDNFGKLPVDPVLRIVGPARKPALFNATTGQFFGLNRDLLIGEEVVIDVEMRTVRVSGASDTSIKAPRSTFWQLARGVNDLRFTADFYDPMARAYVSFRPRWK